MKNKIIIIIIFNLLLYGNTMLNLDDIYIQLDIDKTILKQNIVPEQKELVSIGMNSLGKEIFLSKQCASAWTKMQNDAKKDSINMTIVSGFRSYKRQYAIINYKTFFKYSPVNEVLIVDTDSGVPSAIINPPPSPPSGPKSIIQSDDLMTSKLCSITTTVLPLSTNP